MASLDFAFITFQNRFNRSSKGASKPIHTKIALVGVGVCLSAFALPSPWSWITFVIGLQLFAPIVGKFLGKDLNGKD